MALLVRRFETWVYSQEPNDSAKAAWVRSVGAKYLCSAEVAVAELPGAVGNIDLIYEATGASRLAFKAMEAMGVNGVFVFTGVPGRKGPVEIDTDLIMRNLVLKNQLVYGTVNAGRRRFRSGGDRSGGVSATVAGAAGSLITGAASAGRLPRPAPRSARRHQAGHHVRRHTMTAGPRDAPPDPEKQRLAEDAAREKNWKRWGPYLAERQWGTVREDYSADGDCWSYLPHDHARSRAYRWGEDGLLGLTDRECRACFSHRAVEREGSDPQRAAVRPVGARGEPRRGRQGALLLSRCDADLVVLEGALQVPAGRVPLRPAGRGECAGAVAAIPSSRSRTPACSTTAATSTSSSSTRRQDPTTS